MNDYSLFELIALGGPVMWALVAVSVISLILFVERALFLHRAQIKTGQFLEGVKNIVRKRRLVEALTVAEETPGPVSAIVKVGLMHFEESEERIRLAMTDAALVEIPALERRVGWLAALAQAAPALGVLGTVLGMITTYQDFEKGGAYATAAVLSGGMWQALLTTAAGLTAGIAARLGHHFLCARVKALAYDMEWVANDVVRFLVLERAGGAVSPVATAPKSDGSQSA